MLNFIAFAICFLLLIFSFFGLKVNLAAIHYVFLAVGAGIGIAYFGLNTVRDFLFA